MDLGLQFLKTNVEIKINILKILYVPIFRQNGQLWLYSLNLPKNGMMVGNSEKSCWNKNQHPRDTPFLKQNRQLELFRTKFLPKMNFRVRISNFRIWNQHLQHTIQNGRFWSFRPKFREIAKLRAIFSFL